MPRTRDRAGNAAEIDVLKAKPRLADAAKHTMAGPEAEAEALKRKPPAGATDPLKAKVAGNGTLDKERLAAGDAIALKEKLAATSEPTQPKLREQPARGAEPRTGRTTGRRALRPVPTPEFAPAWTEVCDVRWWRGHVKSQFLAVARQADATEATIASSPYFRWRKRVPPEESRAAAAALRTLAEALEREGWTLAGRGEKWFSVRFQRELAVDRIGTMAGGESST
jgi:hypothetical protein